MKVENSTQGSISRAVSILGVLVTLAINPWSAYDPINVLKMGVLSSIVLPIFYVVCIKYRRHLLQDSSIILLSLGILACFLCSFAANDRDRFQQIWGVWGRNTGLLTYLCFLSLIIVSAVIGRNFKFDYIFRTFHKLSYFLIIYLFVQILEIDPINWSQKQAIATLGNINFVSAFLGFTIISCTFEILKNSNTITAKIHFALVASISMLLILRSGSVQGLLMAAAGIIVILAFRFGRVLSKKTKILVSILIMLTASFLAGGALGMGPLGSELRQESFIYRLDYWRAGIAMTTTAPFFGRGMDSYGNYYREFRDSIAATRTGPQRTSNTAHNIFLDLSSGAGILVAILFLGFFLLAAIRVLKLAKVVESFNDVVRLSALTFSFFVYWLISINQIGFTVWGFIFLGLLLGNSCLSEGQNKDVAIETRTKKNMEKSFQKREVYNKQTIVFQISVICILLLGVAASYSPINQDMKTLSAARSKNLSALTELLNSNFTATELRNKILLELSQQISPADFLSLVIKETERDNRNTFAWNAVLSLGNANDDLKRQALKELRDLDPENLDFKKMRV